MRKYRIADFIVGVESRYERVYRQAEPYRVSDDAVPDFCLEIPEDKIDAEVAKLGLSRDDSDYALMRFLFQEEALKLDCLVLHSSGIVYDGRAYLFSANSGTGKSTHTQLWIERFGADKAIVINDDAPAIRKVDGQWLAYGTPWSGSTAINANVSAPLQGIAFLERAETNWTRAIDPVEALGLFMKQSMKPLYRRALGRAFDKTIELLTETPVFRVGCTMDLDAPRVTYEAMIAAQPKRGGENI